MDNDPAHANRATVDRRRDLYDEIYIMPDGGVEYLGDVGPRIEVKADNSDTVQQFVKTYGLDNLTYSAPDRSYELVLSSMARDRIPFMPFGHGMPETKTMLSLNEEHTSRGVIGIVKAFIEDSEQLSLLLTSTPDIHRLRRFHICQDDKDIVTVVETPDGRLSQKRGRDPHMTSGGGLVRDLETLHDFDAKNAPPSPALYIADQGLTKVTDFIKRQRTVLFTADDPYGTCFRATYADLYRFGGAVFKQLVLEFAGARLAPPPAQAAQTSASCHCRTFTGLVR